MREKKLLNCIRRWKSNYRIKIDRFSLIEFYCLRIFVTMVCFIIIIIILWEDIQNAVEGHHRVYDDYIEIVWCFMFLFYFIFTNWTNPSTSFCDFIFLFHQFISITCIVDQNLCVYCVCQIISKEFNFHGRKKNSKIEILLKLRLPIKKKLNLNPMIISINRKEKKIKTFLHHWSLLMIIHQKRYTDLQNCKFNQAFLRIMYLKGQHSNVALNRW